MALSGGHWANLANMLKLTSHTLIPGVVDEDIKRNNPATLLPLAQANHTGSKVVCLRSNATLEDAVADVAIGGQTSWSEATTYTEVEKQLRACYLQTKLDKFNPAIYSNWNDYEEVSLNELLEAITKKLGDKTIYDDYTYGGGLQMDGIHALAAENSGNLNIDGGETALSMRNWRLLNSAMKYGVDFWLVPEAIALWIDAAYQEKGLAGLASGTAGTMGSIQFRTNEIGDSIGYFANRPIVRCDYLVAENFETGAGSDARAKHDTGTPQYSIFGIKLGMASLKVKDPGLKLLFGMTEENGQMVNLEYFEKLEGFIAKGMRVAAYTELLAGSSMAVGRIYDITDAAITV